MTDKTSLGISAPAIELPRPRGRREAARSLFMGMEEVSRLGAVTRILAIVAHREARIASGTHHVCVVLGRSLVASTDATQACAPEDGP